MSTLAEQRARAWLETPAGAEWEEALGKKITFLTEASRIVSGWFEGVSDLDELNETIGYIEANVARLKEIRAQLEDLEDDFPLPEEPCREATV